MRHNVFLELQLQYHIDIDKLRAIAFCLLATSLFYALGSIDVNRKLPAVLVGRLLPLVGVPEELAAQSTGNEIIQSLYISSGRHLGCFILVAQTLEARQAPNRNLNFVSRQLNNLPISQICSISLFRTL